MAAAQNGHNEAVKILVQHGAGVDMQYVVSTLYSDILLPYSKQRKLFLCMYTITQYFSKVQSDNSTSFLIYKP